MPVKSAYLTVPEKEPVQIVIADTFFKRFTGLMGRKASGYGLLLTPCNAIHTCFMRYDLDIVFLDRDNRVLEVINGIKPWRLTKAVGNARSVLEFPTALQLSQHLGKGMKLDLQPR